MILRGDARGESVRNRRKKKRIKTGSRQLKNDFSSVERNGGGRLKVGRFGAGWTDSARGVASENRGPTKSTVMVPPVVQQFWYPPAG